MKRKVMVVSFAILLLIPSIGMLCSQRKPRILFDEHYARWKPSKHLIDFSGELQKKGYSLEFSDEWMGSLSPSEYGALVLFIPFRYFHDTEKGAIRSFVENGGGLILFGEHGGYMDSRDITSSVNSISEMFGIEFSQDVVLDSEKNREDIECHTIISTFASHPVTKDIKSIGYICGCSLEVQSRATALAFGNLTTTADGKKGKNVVVLAAAEYGKGRVVAVGDTDFLVGSSTRGYEKDDFLSFEDNKKLALKMFEWAVRKVDTTEADELAIEGNTYFSQGKYSQAKSKFEEALEIYLEADTREKVAEMQDMIDECDKGLDADAVFQNGMEYYDREEYNTALTEFEQSKLLYSELGDSRRSSEAQVWIETCYKALKKRDAEDAYGIGEEYYNEGNYESALTEFEKSKLLYSELGDSGGSSEAQSMIDMCSKVLNAEAAYRDGMEYYNSGEYELARSKFEEAIPLYRELGNDTKAQELENKLGEAQEAMKRIAKRNRMLGVIGILVAVVCAFLFVFIFLKKPGTQERPEILYPDVVYCTSCGKENVRGTFYCKYCKTPLKPLDELEKENILKDLRKKFEGGDITEEEYRKLVTDLEESL